MTIQELKRKGLQAFKANYWRCVIAAVLLVLLLGGVAAAGTNSTQEAMDEAEVTVSEAEIEEIFNGMPAEEAEALAILLLSACAVIAVVGVVLRIFVFNPLKVGCYRFFNKNAVDSAASLGVIKEGFGAYGHTLATLFLMDLFVFLCSILLIIPGVVKAYSYRLVPYIIKDNPELSAMGALRRSEEMMKGNRWKAFLLDLSFIGWFLLGVITCGVGFVFWESPYHHSANAVFYHELKD